MDDRRTKLIDFVTNELRNSIANIVPPRVECDIGEIRCVDSNETEIYFGLFEIDQLDNTFQSHPTALWTVELSVDFEENGQ